MTKVKKIVAGVATVAGVLAFSGQAAHADATPAKTAAPATGEQTKQDTLAEQVEKAPNVVAAKDNAAKAGQTTTTAQSTATDAQTQAATATDQNQTATQAQSAAQAKVDAAQKLVDQTSAAQQVAQTAKDQAAATAAAQDGVVKTDQAAVDAAAQKQQAAQTVYDQAKTAATNATPENIQNTQGQVEQTKTAVASDTKTEQVDSDALTQAKSDQDAAQKTAATTKQTAQTDQANESTAQAAVNKANGQVDQDTTNLATQKTALDTAQKTADKAKDAVAADNTNIATTQNDINSKTQDLTTAQSNLESIKSANSKVIQAMSDRQIYKTAANVIEAQIDRFNSLKGYTPNTITLPAGYGEALANVAKLTDKLAADKAKNAANPGTVSEDELTADQNAVDAAKTVLQTQVATNTYHSNAADQKLTFSDITNLNNLDDETSDNDAKSIQIRNELSMFTADMINQIRTALGNTATSVSQGAVDFANDVAKKYNQDKWDVSQQHAHDVAAITSVASEPKYGLNSADNYYESLGNGYVNITPDSNGKIAGNVDQLKEAIYNAIKDMMLNDQDSNFLHAVALSGQNDPTATSYVGTSFDGLGQVHFEIVTDTPAYIPASSNFNKDVMSLEKTPTPGVADNLKDANYLELMKTNASANLKAATASNYIASDEGKAQQGALDDAQAKVDQLNADLVQANTQLKTQKAQLATDTDAQTKANADVATQQAKVDELTKTLTTDQQAATDAQTALKAAQTKAAASQTAATTAAQALTDANTQVTELTAKLAQDQATTKADTAKLNTLSAMLADYQKSAQILNTAKINLDTTNQDLQTAKDKLAADQKVQAQDAQDLETKTQALAAATKAYQDALAALKAAEAELANAKTNATATAATLAAATQKVKAAQAALAAAQTAQQQADAQVPIERAKALQALLDAAKPTTPVTPTDPTEPTTPVTPTEPTEPTTPVTPTEPTAPTTSTATPISQPVTAPTTATKADQPTRTTNRTTKKAPTHDLAAAKQQVAKAARGRYASGQANVVQTTATGQGHGKTVLTMTPADKTTNQQVVLPGLADKHTTLPQTGEQAPAGLSLLGLLLGVFGLTAWRRQRN